MKRIDTTTAVPDMFGPGKSGWRNGNKAQGIPATEFNADWPNNVQEEICNVIEAAGITLDGNNRAQLLQAIRGIIAGGLATEEIAGIARIATAEEAEAGEDDATIITPAKLANALKGVPQGNYSNVFSIETSNQLDERHFGSLIYAGYDTPGIVITLPQSNAAAKGKKITLSSNRAGIIISPYAGDHIRYAGYTHTEDGFFLPGFGVVTLVCNGIGNWTVVAGVGGVQGWRNVSKTTGVVYTNEGPRVINAMISGISTTAGQLAIVEIEKTGDSGIYSRGLFLGNATSVGITASLSIGPGESYRYGTSNVKSVYISEQTI